MIYGYALVSAAAQDLTPHLAHLKAAGCAKVFRERIAGTVADRSQIRKLIAVLAPGDVVITPAVDRLSRDTTDLLIIAREMQRAGAGIRSLAEPLLDTTSDFAEIVSRSLALPRSSNAAASLSARHEAAPTRRRRASNSGANLLSRRISSEAQKQISAGETQHRSRHR